ncbi:hypothetical protein GQX73_g8946 [Xylaria multiplex]|uniref:Uncharacterized protein n=1 Tax=Xylaria multiplex TaxID=323545 RepID=A0A7C8MSP4_9PEZI|nr:hypothetical protein GQX73_g8946 [Xylaria multiplex]
MRGSMANVWNDDAHVVTGVTQQLVIDTDQSVAEMLALFHRPGNRHTEKIRRVAKILLKIIALVKSVSEYVEREVSLSEKEIEEILFGGAFGALYYLGTWYLVYRPLDSSYWFYTDEEIISAIERPIHGRDGLWLFSSHLSLIPIDSQTGHHIGTILPLRSRPFHKNENAQAGWDFIMQKTTQQRNKRK